MIDTHGMVIDFGKHKGTPYTQTPVSYLKWMVGSNHSRAEIAEAELQRRGTVTPDLDVSGHAIDRASVHCRKIWHETKNKEAEGLYSWLCRVAAEALEKEDMDDKGRYRIHGMKLAFEFEGRWPVLKTVIRD